MRVTSTVVFENNYDALYNSNVRFIINQGGSRSSKTYSLCQLIIVYCLQNPNKVVSNVAVVQLLEPHNFEVGQSITLSGINATWNGTHKILALPEYYFIGVSQQGDYQYDTDTIIPNQVLFALTTADAVEYARYEDDEDLVGQAILGATWGLYSYVGQQPFLTGISSIAGAFSQTIPNPKQAFKDALNQVASTAAQYVIEGSPVGMFSSARSQIERIVDPNKRETGESPNLPTIIKGFYEGINKPIAKTPFLSDSLGKQYDWLGEEMMDIDPANPWLASISGVRFSTSKQRPADKIAIELGMSIKKPGRSITMGDVSVKLEPDEYEYMMRQ